MSFRILMDTHELVMQPQQSKAKRKKTCAHIFWKILHISIISSYSAYFNLGTLILEKWFCIEIIQSMYIVVEKFYLEHKKRAG